MPRPARVGGFGPFAGESPRFPHGVVLGRPQARLTDRIIDCPSAPLRRVSERLLLLESRSSLRERRQVPHRARAVPREGRLDLPARS